MSDQTLREALEKELRRWESVPVQVIAALLAAHPAEPAPVASRERVAEVLREAMSFEPGHAHGLLLTQQANRAAHRLLAAGVFRDEAEVIRQVRSAIDTEEAKEIGETTEIDNAYNQGLADASELARRVGAGELP